MTMDRSQVFAHMNANGIAKIVVSFSGGNDEGGADGMTAHLTNGTTKEMQPGEIAYQEWPENSWVVHDYDQATHTSTKRPATPEEIALTELNEALEGPIYDTYGGFAGEFHVSGVLTWDAAARTAKMTGEESSEVSEPFERDA